MHVESVDEYLATVPEKDRTALENLRQAIKSAAPQAEEIISYKIPTYKYYGPVVHFKTGKNYCSLIVVSQSILELFKKELEHFKISGRTIHFSAENPLPATLVKKIVKTRMKENEDKAKSK